MTDGDAALIGLGGSGRCDWHVDQGFDGGDMLSWLRRRNPSPPSGIEKRNTRSGAALLQAPAAHRPPPMPATSNPGRTVAGPISFTTGDGACTEHIDMLEYATRVFEHHGHRVSRHASWLVHDDSGFQLCPRLANFKPTDIGVSTTTTIQTSHPTLIPQGLFEYQHASGQTVEESIVNGFDQWLTVDFLTLLDARLDRPTRCTFMDLELPGRRAAATPARRAVLGPVAHLQERQPALPANAVAEPHPFCACCLLTSSFDTFRPLLEGDEFLGLRLFAMRDEHGRASADCRVNGDEFEPGKAALRAYVAKWPDAGVEYRKQYVVLQSVAAAGRA